MEILDNPINKGVFLKGNTYGQGRPKGSKNKKTIVKESLERLNEVGIKPLETTNEILSSLLNNKDTSIDQKIKLLGVTTSLLKYELLTRSEEIKYDELLTENLELKEKNQELKDSKDTYFTGSPQDLIKELKKQEK